ncbi:MAG: tRNA (guanosine(37)-N1)-methyltransferase TrmD [Patescibacteria group bacterium]
MHFHVITLFPESFDSYLKVSILGRALRGDKPRRLKGSGSRPQASGKIKISFYNPRDFAKNKWHRVDQKPYGGGPGMVLEAESVLRAVEAALKKAKSKNLKPKSSSVEVVFFDTSGAPFTNTQARVISKKKKHVIFICGRYEGIDARVQKILKAKKVSVGDYTLTGGELPALVMIDAISRQIPGVLGTFESVEEERVASSEVYTRPEVLTWKGKKYKVPSVLLSGNHKDIEAWKRKEKK